MDGNSALNEEISDQERRHELRKQLKLLKLSNMKMKKQLRMASRVRFLNRMRLEGEITQLNSVVSTLRKAVLGRNDPTPDRTENFFANPESSEFNESINVSNTNKISYQNGDQMTATKSSSERNGITDEFKFFCDKCDFKCKKKTPFDIHLRRHSGERPFICDVCSKTFVAKYELKLHSAKHTKANKYSCDECDFTTYRPDMLVNHREKHFELKILTCDLCSFKTDERSKIISHRKTHSKPVKIPCRACDKGKIISDDTALHSTLNGDTSQKKSPIAGENISLSLKDENIIDIGSNRDKEDVGCVKKRKKIGLRELKHTCETPWICDVCGNSFKKRESLSKHLRTHSGERPFKCDRCTYSAATKHTLIIHLRKHSGEKPYSCDKCSFRCSTRSYLKIHLNNHQGIKPFACHLCPYRSVDSCKLSAHKRTKHITTDANSATVSKYNIISSEHRGMESFVCTLCKTAKHFTVEAAFKRHISRHHRPTLACHKCDFTTSVGKDLKRHLNTHDKEQICRICNYRTSQMNVFIKHMTTQHPDEPSLLVQSQNVAANITTKPPIQPIVGTIIPTAVLPYAFSPMILNIPNAQSLKPLNKQGNSVVSVQNVVTNQGLVHYQQATLVPTLNFYWGAQS